MIDDTGDESEPWLPCKPPRWCADFGDRISASMINRRLPYVFKEGSVGMVLSPTRARISCSFFADGGTMTRRCHGAWGCVPGCCSNEGYPSWCDDVRLESENVYGCAFRPKDLGAMMRHHEMRKGSYNEVIIDPRTWSHDGFTNAPTEIPITAFYFIKDPPPAAVDPRFNNAMQKLGKGVGSRRLGRTPRDDEEQARTIHSKFHRIYPNSEVPLLRLELEHLERPFTRVA